MHELWDIEREIDIWDGGGGIIMELGMPLVDQKKKVWKIKEETREECVDWFIDSCIRIYEGNKGRQTGCCPINCISTNIMYWNNKQTKQCADGEKWGYTD